MAHHKRNGCSNQRHFDETLLPIFYALLDGIRNFTRLTQTDADVAGPITDHNQCAIAKATSTFDYLRDAGNLDDSLLQVKPVCVNFWHILPRALEWP
jgi:hypothetical protein